MKQVTMILVFVLIAVFSIPGLAFVYDDFSSGTVDSNKWSLSGPSVMFYVSPSGMNFRSQTGFNYLYLKSGSELCLTGHTFQPGETLDFDFMRIIGDVGLYYGDAEIFKAWAPSATYHARIVFLTSNSFQINISGLVEPKVMTFTQSNPKFCVREAYPNEAWVANFAISYINDPLPPGTASPALKSVGENCAHNYECQTKFCWNGTCNSATFYCPSYCDTVNCLICDVDCICNDTSVCIKGYCKSKTNTSCIDETDCPSGKCVHNTCRNSETFCGDGYCDLGENCSICPNDCGVCKNGTCYLNSICGSGLYCVHSICRDTQTFCGDSFCDSGEGIFDCFADCKQHLYFPIFLSIVGIAVAATWRNKKIKEEHKRKKEEAFRKRQLKKGLVEYDGNWMTKTKVAALEREREKRRLAEEKARREAEEKARLINRIIHEIQKFRPSGRYTRESDYHKELQGWLRKEFPNAKIEHPKGHSRPDIVINDVAIEVKGPTGKTELDTIPDKCERYGEDFPGGLVVVLFDVRASEGYSEWKSSLKRSFPNVHVIRKD